MADGSLIFDTGIDTKGIKKDLQGVESVAKGVFTADIIEAFAAKAGAAIKDLAAGMIEVGSAFETSMSQVAATMGITTEEIAAGSADFEKLSQAAKDMGATTKYTAAEAAEGLNILAMAGLNADESISTLPSVLSLAAAGAMDLSKSASYVTGAVKGFADEMDNAQYYADLIAKGATMANTNVDALGEALSGASASANAYGQSADTVTLALLRLAEQNVTGSEAATAMSRAMADLYTPTSNGATALAELGMNMYEANGDARDFNDVVDELNAKLSEMSMEERLAYENTIFTTFGMKAFQKMTVSTTEKVEQFADGLRDASGSAMQQMETQIDNLEGKLAILNSATEAVGIEFYEIFEDMMKGAVVSATDAMTRFQKEISTGKLGASLRRLADAIGDFADRAIDAAEDIIPVLIEGLTWILEHSREIGAAIKGIGTGFLVFKTATGIIGAASTVMGLLSIATGEATAAQLGLNAAMAANPYVLILTAAAGLTVGLIALSNAAIEANSSINEVTDASVQAAEQLAETNEKIAESASKRAEDLGALDGQAEVARSLAAELLDLNSKTTLTAGEQDRMASIVQQLNALFPELNLQLDEYGRLTEKSAEALTKNVEAMIKQSKAAAAQEKLTEIAEEQLEVEVKLAEARKQIAKQTEKANETGRRYATMLTYTEDQIEELYGGQIAYENALQATKDEHDAEKEVLSQLNKEYGATVETMNALDDEYNAVAEAIGNEADAAEEATDANNALAESEQNATGMTEEMQKAYEDMADALKKSIESQTGLFKDLDDAAKVSFGSVKKNLEDQIDSLKNWSTNMRILAAEGVDQGILAELADMGPEGAAYVEQFVKMSTDELGQINDLYREKAQISGEAQAWVLQSWSDAGYGLTLSMAESLMNSPEWETLDQVTKDRIQQVVESAKVEAQKAEEAGKALIDSAVAGLIGGGAVGQLSDAAKQNILNAAKAAQDGAGEGGEDVGKEYVEKTADGITENAEVVVGAATDMATQVVDATNTTLGTTDGPSTVTYQTGMNVDQGAANGMTENAQVPIQAATDVATGVYTEFEEGLSFDKMHDLGMQIDAGLEAGIRDGQSGVISAAVETAAAAYAAAKAELDVESPSKKFRYLGEMCVAGFEQGAEELTDGTVFKGITSQIGSTQAMMASSSRSNQNINNNVTVTLEGDAKRLFQVMRQESSIFSRTTGSSAFA